MQGSKNKFAFEIIESNFFEDVKNFKELINKIQKGYDFNDRGIEKTKGDIFEIFTEAYLKTNSEYQIKEVYPQGYVPNKIRKKLNLSFQDRGYDGVYETQDGQINTYQSKFRSKDEQLTWQGKNGLSSFIGVSEKAHKRHLIASTNKVSSEFLSKSRIQLTLLSDLKKLNKNDFLKINNFLKKRKIEIHKHKPEKYQKIAINKVLKEFKHNNKATIIMACGTGKTEIGLWVCEKIKPKTALVLVPSIALVKQIRASWLSQIDYKIATYQLCSSKDVTKQEDHIQVKKNDLDMEFHSDVKGLKKWLKKNQKLQKIIFSTYQSSKLLRGIFNKKKPIDFAVFDEAHRTAILNSKVDSYFSYALHDKNIFIKKRLFMTATRRVSSLSKFRRVGDSILNVSMDNEKLYGNVCYNLSFYEAAKKYKAIAKPRIIISEVYSDEVSAEKRKYSSTHVKGLKIKSDYLALIIAIKKAIKKYNINKVFSFHRTVNDAKIFSDPTKPESINSYLDNFFTNYVSGAMNMRKRDEIMDEFVSSKKGFISNARCLVEGVNVPSVDMVSFTHQKESEVDIVQAIGRALRNRNQNKKFGYVLVPIFVEKSKNESIEKALERTNYKKVIILLKALREHDTEIAQIIDEILINEGRGKGFSLRNRKKLSNLIECVNPEIQKKVLIKSIHTKVIENLRLKWDEMVGRLLDFKNKYKHTNVGYKDKEFLELRYWLSSVRYLYKTNKLYNFQIEQLLKLGVSLNEPGVNIFDKKNYYTFTQLGRRFFSRKTLANYITDGTIKPIGKAFVPGEGPVDVFKKYTDEEMCRTLKIDLIDRENKFLTKSLLAKKLKIDRETLDKEIQKKTIKPIGITLVSGQKKKVEVFKPLNLKKFHKAMGITLSDSKNYLTMTKLSTLIFGVRTRSTIIKKAIKENKIKPAGYGLHPGTPGVVPLYKKISKEEFKKALKIDLLDTSNYLSKNALGKHLKIGNPRITTLIKKKIIQPIGRGIGPADKPIDYFKKINEKELLKITKIDFINKTEYISKSMLAKRTKLSRATIQKLIKHKLIKPIGKTFIQGKDIDFVYKNFSRANLIKIILDNKKYFFNYKKFKV